MPRTLVTGANGFVAAHVIDQLIAIGNQVTGSVRSTSKGEQLLRTHPEYAGKLSFVIVTDYALRDTWDNAFQGGDFDYIVHTAAPLLDDPQNTDFVRDFLEPSVNGAIELLESATKHGKNVKAVAITGSINAMTTGSDLSTRVFTSDEWLPLSIEDAVKEQNPYISYCVAKAESEKAIWKYVREKKPSYTVSVLLPALIFGPPIQPITSLKKINYSSDVFYSLFNGTYDIVPQASFASYIDVRDLADAHIKALTVPEVANKRFLVGGKKFSSTLAVNILKSLPELDGRLPKDFNEAENHIHFGDVEEWNTKLGLSLRTAKETFLDSAGRILELEKEFK